MGGRHSGPKVLEKERNMKRRWLDSWNFTGWKHADTNTKLLTQDIPEDKGRFSLQVGGCGFSTEGTYSPGNFFKMTNKSIEDVWYP